MMKKSVSNVRQEVVMRKLAEYGVKDTKDLNEAFEKMQPLKIGCMVSPVRVAGGALKAE